MEEENYLAITKNELKAIENKILAAKKNVLYEQKDVLVDLIEKEITSRYFYQKGKIEIGLRNDAEIVEAIGILGNKAKYDNLLSGQ